MSERHELPGAARAFARGCVVTVLVAVSWWLTVVADLSTMDGRPGRWRGLAILVIAFGLLAGVWRLIESRWLRRLVTIIAALPPSAIALVHVAGLIGSG